MPISWRKVTLNDLGPELGIDLTIPHFDVTDQRFAGGAKGDGVTDDTLAIQAAINAGVAAQGTVVFPPANGAGSSPSYRTTSTLQIVPGGVNTQAYVNLIGQPGVEGQYGMIAYDGPNSQPVFSTRGWRNSSAWNLGIKVPGTKTGVIGWDIDTTASAISSTGLEMHNCNIFYATNHTSGIGWNMGASGLTNDISLIDWYGCQIYGAGDATKNNIGWQFNQANAIGFNWYGGLGYYLNPMVKMVGGEGFNFYGLSGTHNAVDFLDTTAAQTPILIFGGRFEFGQKFLRIDHNTGQPNPVIVSGTKLYKYAPSDNIIFYLLGLPQLELRNMQITNPSGSDYTSQMISNYSDAAGVGHVRVAGGVIQAPYPFHSTIGGSTATFRVRCESVSRINNAGVYTATLGADQANALAYSGTIATDANLSDYFTIAATNGTAFTISTPTNPFPGRTITYDIKNSSGGAHGVITWGAGFLNGGAGTVGTGAFAGIANTKRRTITFKYDGTNWIELSRTADI